MTTEKVTADFSEITNFSQYRTFCRSCSQLTENNADVSKKTFLKENDRERERESKRVCVCVNERWREVN